MKLMLTACIAGLIGLALSSENVALNKPASQVSTDGNKVASRAVDGNYDTVSCTKVYVHPWWAVDLGEAYDISHVSVTNDKNRDRPHRLDNFVVGLTNDDPATTAPVFKSSYTLCGQWSGSVGHGATATINCAPSDEKYRYVIIQGSHAGVKRAICLAEVAVYLKIECPDDWSEVESVQGCYKVLNTVLNWDGAGQGCQQLNENAHLVVINDADEQSAIESVISADKDDACILKGHGYNYWIAGQRVDPTTESEFIWRVGTEEYPMTYEHWQTGEPNYGGANGEHCAHLWGKYNNYWNDLHCEAELCAVCQIDL